MSDNNLNLLNAIEIFQSNNRQEVDKRIEDLPPEWKQRLNKVKMGLVKSVLEDESKKSTVVDFSRPPAMTAPMKLAADSSDGKKRWVESVELIFPDLDGSSETRLNLQQSSESSSIQIDMYPSEFIASNYLKPNAGKEVTYALIHGETVLAILTGIVEPEGDFLTAEGEVHQDYLLSIADAEIGLKFRNI